MARRAATQHQPYQPGDLVVGGKYRLEELVGAGAFGQVYRVRHLGLDGARALKVIRKDAPGIGSTSFQGYRERLRLEFRLAERVKHRNVIAIYDLIDEPDALFAEMELAEGGSVAELLRKEGHLPADRVVAILRDAAEGLAALHQAGAVHRDVKPANLLMSADGTVKVSDLGLAQWAAGGGDPGDSFGGSTTTRHAGSVDYSSPEHDLLQPLYPTSDVYGLGCVAFELLTGRKWKEVRYEVAGVTQLRAEVPAWLDAVVMRMLVETPGSREEADAAGGKRYASTGGVLAALKAGATAKPDDLRRRPKPAPDPALMPPAYESLLDSLDADDFDGALEDIATLEGEGFTLVDLTPLRQSAELGRRRQQRKAEAARRYAAVAALARSARTQALLSAEWKRFRADFPEHDDDPVGLAQMMQGGVDDEREAAEQRQLEMRAKADADAQAAADAEAREAAERSKRLDAEAKAAEARQAREAADARQQAAERLAAETEVNKRRQAEADAEGARRDRERRELDDAKGTKALSISWPTVLGFIVVVVFMLWVKLKVRGGIDTGGSNDGLPDIAWVEVPAGPFIMGSNDHDDGEKPQRTITLSAFKISKYETTNAQYQAFVAAEDGYRDERWWNQPVKLASRDPDVGGPNWTGDDLPAETVSWYDAVAYTRWLTSRLRVAGELEDGTEIRLPTEEEWEKAARGTDGREYPWGNGYQAGYANLDETNTNAGSAYLERTTPVGAYPQGASPFGALDMAGNVWEWTLTEYENKRSADLASNRPRVVRGGSWYDYPDGARASYRDDFTPGKRFSFIGFRVVVAAPVQ